jgi:hypothetical protein
VERLREAARTLAWAGYWLCYGVAGALFAWVSFLFVALWFEWEATEVTTCSEAGSIIGGLLFAAWLAWRARSNTWAHVSLVGLGVVQVVSSGAYVSRVAFVAETVDDWLFVGLAFWIGATAAIGSVGGICGLAAQALTDSAVPGGRCT